MKTIKAIQINLQTTLFFDKEDNILGAYNKHTDILVYNKPLVLSLFSSTNYLVNMIELTGAKKTFPTDSFGINFYNHNTGGTSEFYEITQPDEEDEELEEI